MLTARLERVWRELRRLHPAIPPAVIVLYSVPTRRPRQNGGVLLGHFSAAAWVPRSNGQGHEIGINPRLFGEPKEVLGVLLPEAAHAVLNADSQHGKTHWNGCSLTDHRYHTAKFRDLCQSWGMECRFRNRRYGFCDTGWPNGVAAGLYRDVLRYIEKNIPQEAQRTSYPPIRRQKHLVSLRCQCEDRARIVYVRHRVLQIGRIRCDLCGDLFVEQDLSSSTFGA